MKQVFRTLLCMALILTLSGCAADAGGVYKLDHATANGLRLSPDSYGMNIQLELKSDGAGTASYSGTTMDISWEEDGSSVTVKGPNGELEFTKEGHTLILHDKGTMLFFEPVQEDK